MSTLMSSASPAASPRLKYKPTYRAIRSPRGPSAIPSQAAETTQNRAEVGPTSAPVSQPYSAPPPTSTHQYVDEGTQYSPEGYPPTAVLDKISRLPVTGSKRKQGANSQGARSPTNPSTKMAVSEGRSPASTNAASRPTTDEVDSAVAAEGVSHEEKEQDEAAPQTQATSAAGMLKRPRTDSQGHKIMPRQYETCDPMDLGVLIADMLLELIRLNDKIPLKDGKLTRFHSRAPPGISCHDYLRRLIQHATLSPPILLSMVFYIDKLCNMYPAFTIGSLTVHRFLITAATVASKGLSDSFWTNPTYARIGGISTSELATLELDFLQRVDFKIVPKPETLVDYYYSLVQRSQDYRLEDETAPSLPDPDKMETEPT